jgi:hypothetical protein
MMMGSEKGSVLVIVIVGVTIIAAIGAGVATMVGSGARTGVDHSLSVQALYAAESGLEWAGFRLKEEEKSEAGSWATYCEDQDLIEEEPPPIGPAASFSVENTIKILNDDGDPIGCEITVTGWVGDKNNPLSSRRLKGSIPEDKIEGGGDGSTQDIFYNLDGWGGGGNKVSYDNGLKFDVNSNGNSNSNSNGNGNGNGNGNNDTLSVKLNRNGNSEIVDENSFDDNSDVYFFVKIDNWENVASLKIGNNSWEGNCDPISECQDSEGSDTFSVLLENISKENVNDPNVSLDVVFQESGTVTFEGGCIASTIEKCAKTNSTSQNPVDSWNED